MDSRSSAELLYCYPFRQPYFTRRAMERVYREEASREAWLTGVQHRLGLVTRADVDSLIEGRITALGGAMWPS